MTRRRRILLYVLSLGGTGHFVRIFELARALAEEHEVLLLDGGRAVPRPQAAIRRLALPRVRRAPDGAVVPVDEARSIDEVLAERRRLLEEALRELRPDIVLTEDFPFSKWEMADECGFVTRTARELDGGARVVCSLRDIGTRKVQRIDPPDFTDRVLRTLRAWYDLVLVHADPKLVRVEEHLPWVARVEVPLRYTGYVSERCRAPGPLRPGAVAKRRVVVSTGGAAADGLISWVVRAWRAARPRLAGCPAELLVFLPPHAGAEELARWRRETDASGVEFRLFSPDFLEVLAGAELSISHSGYNTCANLMETRTRAILIPNTGMSDQSIRAWLLAQRGLAEVLDLSRPEPGVLADAIVHGLALGPTDHDVDLEGAVKTRSILAAL